MLGGPGRGSEVVVGRECLGEFKSLTQADLKDGGERDGATLPDQAVPMVWPNLPFLPNLIPLPPCTLLTGVFPSAWPTGSPTPGLPHAVPFNYSPPTPTCPQLWVNSPATPIPPIFSEHPNPSGWCPPSSQLPASGLYHMVMCTGLWKQMPRIPNPALAGMTLGNSSFMSFPWALPMPPVKQVLFIFESQG